MKKIKLEPGQVWQVPDKKWIRVRVITFIRESDVSVYYVELGELGGALLVERKDFLRWIRRNKAKLIGIKDFKTGKVRVVK